MVVNVDCVVGVFLFMCTFVLFVGCGWEYFIGIGWDFDVEIAELFGLLREHVKVFSVEVGCYDFVIDLFNLWLMIYELIGYVIELDCVLGYEVVYVGMLFAMFDKFNEFVYGSLVMNVIGDCIVEHGLVSIGYDDEGVVMSEFDIVCDGILVGY